LSRIMSLVFSGSLNLSASFFKKPFLSSPLYGTATLASRKVGRAGQPGVLERPDVDELRVRLLEQALVGCLRGHDGVGLEAAAAP
jgi:hypothetical protein